MRDQAAIEIFNGTKNRCCVVFVTLKNLCILRNFLC
jgi:hypothetical protein